MTIFNYTVTSNHIHLLVVDDGERDIIPKSIQLVAGRTGQEYNQRKKRKGAFWEDRYHATAVENGDHLYRCLVYIDLNMVRTGVVEQPSQWPCCGDNEIRKPRKRNILIHHGRLRGLQSVESNDQLKLQHKGWVEEYLNNDYNRHDDKWTKSIALGSKSFVEKVRSELGILAKGRKAMEVKDGYQLREPSVFYGSHSKDKNVDIGADNTYFWGVNL